MVAISSLEQGTLVGDRYRLVEPIDRFTPASGGPSGAGFGYWLAFDEVRGCETWLLFAEHRGRAATGADVAGAVSMLRRLGHRAVPAVPDFGEIEFEVADADVGPGAEADAGDAAESVADAGAAVDSMVESVGYAVLEPVDGESLSALLLRGALTEAEVFAVLRETAQLLRELHAAELVHGHLSVYSVLVAERGVRVVDLPAALALESAFDSGLTAAADVYAFCWLACLALVGVDGIEVELGAGYDAGSSPEDMAAPAFLTADLIGRRRAWAEAALVDVYGLQADLAAWLVAGLGEASQRPTIDVVAEALYAVGPGAVGAETSEAVAGSVVEDTAAEAQGEMIGIVAGAVGYEVQVGRLPEAGIGSGIVGGTEDEWDEEEAVAVAAETAGPRDVAPGGVEIVSEQAIEQTAGEAAGGVAVGGVAAVAAAAAVGMAAEAVIAGAAGEQLSAERAAPAQVSASRETPTAAEAVKTAEASEMAEMAETSQAAVASAVTAGAAVAAPAARGGVGVARRPAATHSRSGGVGGSGGSGRSGGSSPATPAAAPVAFTAGAHRRPPRSAVLVAAGITALIIAGGAWALAEHHSAPPKPTAGASGSATVHAPSPSVPGAGAGSSATASARASASASAPQASPSSATGSPASGTGATPSAAPTTPTPGPLATVPASPGQALNQVKQNIAQAQTLGQLPAAAQGPFNQAVGTLQQEISAGASVQTGVSQLESALNSPGLPDWFTSQMNQLVPYLYNRPGS
ncbi:MAG TPA: hypothetical protein VGM10_17765 [Actinocrinis sp.]